MDAIAYIRWSSDDQAKGDSERRQIESARRLCEQRGWDLIETAIDSGKSAYKGKNRAKGGKLASIEERAAKGLLRGKALIIENIDRLSRQEPIIGLNLINGLVASGITLVESESGQSYTQESVRDNWQTLITPFLRAGLAYDEARTKGRRVAEAFQGTIDRGFVTKDGLADLRFVPSWIGRDGADYMVIEERAAIVRRIFERCLAGYGLRSICEELNADLANTRWQKGDWTQANIRDILRGRGALGEFCRHSESAEGRKQRTGNWVRVCDPVISAETWHRAQEALDRRRSSGGKRRGMVNLLQGFTFCAARGQNGMCGSRMIITQTDRNMPRKARLRCARNHRAAGCKSSTSFHYEHLLNGVLDHILHIALDEPEIDNTDDSGLAVAKLELVSAEKRLDNLVDAYANNPSDAMLRGIKRAESEIIDRKAKISQLSHEAERQNNTKPRKELAEEIANLRSRLKDDEDARRRVHAALSEIITSIFLYPETREAHVLVAGIHAFKFDGLGNLLQQSVATSALLPGAHAESPLALDRYRERNPALPVPILNIAKERDYGAEQARDAANPDAGFDADGKFIPIWKPVDAR
ncbi:recombinase family protein [Novosphingobium beihaiensis]|uniref:Recombinase family protein n=1 Tax=Novosphingobium beihaiensis TaxID=2930389 RepID=A0ABT0BVL8_9SPHN|nr:recombinase family protein [Novosphingobium beihaiensis]MCJ2189030.1 recombinase family protein [Novosphingobium beihaiensis]